MSDKSDSSQLMTLVSPDAQLTNHRRQLSADSTSSQQSSLLLANVDDVELNRFTRHVTTSPVTSANDSETIDASLLQPSAVDRQHNDNAQLEIPSAVTDTGPASEDEDGASAPDEPLLGNAFSSGQCKYNK